jgi:hypothetical protein
MSLELQVALLVSQAQQLDTTMSGEIADTNSDVSKLRTRVTNLEVKIGLPDDDDNAIPGGGGSSPTNPGALPGNDVIKVDPDGELIWLWNPASNSWISLPFTEIAPPVELDVGSIIDQANAAIDAGIQDKVDDIIATISGSVVGAQQIKIDGIASTLSLVGTKVDDNTAAIQAESTARATGDSATASQLTTLVAQVNSNNQAFLNFQAAVVADPDGAAASFLQAMQSKIDQNTANLNTEINTRATADTATSSQISSLVTSVGAAQAAVVSEVSARTSADSALTTQLSSLAARVGTAEGAISNVQTVTAGLDGSVATSVSTLTTKVNGMTTTVQDIASSVDGIEGKRSMAINANGQVTGIELLGGGKVGSQIKFQAASLIVYDPSSGVETVPFVISGGATYIKKALIKDADIDTLKIAGNSVIVPKAVTRFDSIASTGDKDATAAQLAISASITMPYGGILVFQFSCSQAYAGWDEYAGGGSYASATTANPNYKGRLVTEFSIRVNGGEHLYHSAAAVESGPTLMGSTQVTPGTHVVEVYWRGQRYDANAMVYLQTRSLLLLGAMR